jgi:hypothetical protein
MQEMDRWGNVTFGVLPSKYSNFSPVRPICLGSFGLRALFRSPSRMWCTALFSRPPNVETPIMTFLGFSKLRPIVWMPRETGRQFALRKSAKKKKKNKFFLVYLKL